MKISVVVSAYNEERNIKACLESIRDVADEIIVVNNTSTDNTGNIARKFTDKVFIQENNPLKIDTQKNFGFSKATGDWILSIDADERLTPALSDEVKKTIATASIDTNGYWISRKNFIFGKWIQSDMWWPDYQLKLFRRGFGKFEGISVHKALTIDGKTEKLGSPLIHENYTSVSQYILKLNNYTDIEAENFEKSGYKFSWLDSVRFPVNDFLKTFFMEHGYREGLHGLVLSILQAFYMEVVFVKLWEKEKFKEVNDQSFMRNLKKEALLTSKKLRYWITTVLINETKNPFKKISLRVVRKLASRRLNKGK